MNNSVSRIGGMNICARVAIVAFGVALLVGCSTTNISQAPPPVPHSAYKEECVVCHREGKNGAPKMNHPSRGSCSSCHRQT